jgi:ribulose-5-phosphate 4-epimerase/fuculose-1-phosphate aldolase
MTEVRRSVSIASRVLGIESHGDLIWGPVSIRDDDSRGVWMKRSGIGFEEVGPHDVLLVDRAGDVIEGSGRRHIEYPIHTEIMAARADVNSVVHTHAQHAVAFASLDTPLLPISHEGTLFVPPEVARFTETGDLIVSPELGQKLAQSLGERNALLLVNHGIVTVGPDVKTAVVTAILLERACRIQLQALAAGPIQNWSDDDEALAKRAHCYPPTLLHQAWDYLVRRLN